jgi:hypothetical protein
MGILSSQGYPDRFNNNNRHFRPTSCRYAKLGMITGPRPNTKGSFSLRDLFLKVRHVLTLPGDNYAYNSNGNIAFFGTTSSIMDVAIHETGHSLDLLGAYGDQLSSRSFPQEN